MDSWWDLGQHSGYHGRDLALFQISCAFCGREGNFRTIHHVETARPYRTKTLNFDTLQCANCANYLLVFWSAGDRVHDYRVVPWPLRYERHPEHWPADIGRYWLQAKRSLIDDNWDAAALMARSALQLALRSHNAAGGNLRAEIDDLARKGLLPPVMQQWSHELRDLGNESAHPKPGGAGTAAKDAKDVVRFLDYFLQFLYTLPHDITEYRKRRNP